MTFLLSFLLFSCAMSQSVHSGADDIFLKGKVEEGIKVFVFDGFKLGSVNREAEFIKENVPVTEGNWFVLFFVKDGYIPGVRVLRAGKEDMEIGKVGFEKRMDEDKGFLTGVVYKPVHGGKVLYSRGIFKLIDGIDIKVISDKGESYLTRSKGGGIFSISLIPGKYRIFIGDSEEWIKEIQGTVYTIEGKESLITYTVPRFDPRFDTPQI